MNRWRQWAGSTGIVLCMGVTHLAQGACDANRDTSKTDARFEAKDDVVHDKVANLIWKRCSEGQVWNATAGCQGELRKFNCGQANATETHGWRLPTVDELETLVAKGCRMPAVDDRLFPNTPSAPYWTSSRVEPNCWRVEFEYGGVYLSNWWDAHHLRLVRDAK